MNIKNGGRDGKVFGFDFIDMESSEIHISCFNEQVEEFYHAIHSDSLYVISNGRIKVTNTKYSSSTNPYKIILLSSSTITPSTSLNSTIPTHTFHIKSIDSLSSLPINSLVDIIGILLAISPISTIRKRDGTETIKCTAIIVDKSDYTIDVTLWGNHCYIDGIQISDMPTQPNPHVILIKSGRITTWCGRGLDTIFPTKVLMNPNLLEASSLQAWYTSIEIPKPFNSLSKKNLSPIKFANPVDISSIANNKNLEKKNVCIKASISKLHLDNFYYLSCPLLVNNKKCKKKVLQTSPTTFRCPKCSTDLLECDFSYVLKMDLKDASGELLQVTAFEGPANSIMGVFAEDFQLLIAEHETAKDILDHIVGSQLFFDLTIKMIPFDGQKMQSIVITAIKLI